MSPTAHRVVFIEDGCMHDGCDLTPQQVLTKHDSGVYTTALITPDGHVVDWSLHRKRLLRGIEILNTQPLRPFQPLLSFLERQGSSLPQFFDQRVQPQVRTALAAFHASPSSLSSPVPPQHAMLVVCISPFAPGTAATGPAGGQAADDDDGAADANTPAAALARTPLGGSATDRASADEDDDAGDGTGRRACDTTSGGSGSGSGPTAHIAVYCKAVQPPPYGPEHAVQAAVLGRPRSLPGAKACSWVRERRGYEERKPPEAAEVLLADASGRILEGLTTNFCVVTAATTVTTTATTATAAATSATTTTTSAATSPSCGAATTLPGSGPAPPDSAAAAAAAAAPPIGAEAAAAAAAIASPVAGLATTAAAGAGAGAVLRVCGPQADAALPGVVQSRVVEAARRLGLEVVPEPPSAAERGTWSEAFLTNCIRRLQPLSRVFCPPGNAWGADPWDCWLPHPAGPVTSALLGEVERMEERTHWREL
ncbi:hypothetical protein PLESTF_000413700 [Pleodorina starrii]|nr:hypothetical protein PLESTM_001454300 [Pleodorina starrii]GLC66344.1 hypothetical protein PLESTF_000413700 [Pleodorina starrii]